MHPFAPSDSTARPWLIGHRGAAGSAAENTLPSFQRAWQLGVDLIELDLRLSRDEHLVALHDPTLARVAGVDLRADRATAEELRRHHPVPTLSEIIERTPAGRWLNLELKRGEEDRRLLAERFLVELDGHRQVIVSSFDQQLLEEVRSVDGDLAIAPIVERGSPGALAEAAARFASQTIHIHERLVSGALLQGLAERRIEAWAYTVNEPAAAKRFARLGVRGLFSDHPDRLVAAFGR